MDPVTLISLVTGLGGLGLSIYAALTATKAKHAAKAVVERHHEHEDELRLANLISVLLDAKEVAMRRQSGAPQRLSLGRRPAEDLQALRTAHDAINTSLPISLSDDLRLDVANASDDLGMALSGIERGDQNRDGWKDALSTLQSLIPSLEREHRRLNARSLLGGQS